MNNIPYTGRKQEEVKAMEKLKRKKNGKQNTHTHKKKPKQTNKQKNQKEMTKNAILNSASRTDHFGKWWVFSLVLKEVKDYECLKESGS